MRLSNVTIKNYRNFIDSEINFNDKSLVIGPNDVGKTNLLNAIRIVLDKSFSYLDLEPQEKDFNIFSDDEEITIILEFSDIQEDKETYIYSNLGKYIVDGKLYIMYKGYKNKEENFKFFLSGKKDEELFQEINGRNKYINLINCVYLDSTRQLKQFLKKSKTNMIESYKSKRLEEEIIEDEKIISTIDNEVNTLNSNIEKISYIRKSANFIKEELTDMSSHNDNLDIKLSSFNDTEDITDNVELIAEIDGKKNAIGGDGRSNQIYMSMWVKEMGERIDESKQFVIFLLEEPESHLHFPLQAMTIRKIINKINKQFIITTHSPQVVLEFNPYSIVRLYFDKNKKTKIAKNGCSEEIQDEVIDFGYRYNLITGSMFFSSGVFLVEGISELLLFKFLTKKLNMDLEKYNIMILSVEGIGFKPYIKLLNKLEIPFSLRTDNDVVQNEKNKKYYHSGIIRLIKYYNLLRDNSDDQLLKTNFEKQEFSDLTEQAKNELKENIEKFNKTGLFLSELDLENDLANCKFLEKYIEENYNNIKGEFVKYLQNSKAKNMYSFLKQVNNIKVDKTSIGSLISPIKYLMDELNEHDETNQRTV